MADVLFRYLKMSRENVGSWQQRAFQTDERLLAAGLEKIVETAAIRVEFCSQLERTGIITGSAPASKWSEIPFVDAAVRNPPVAPRIETRADHFPLRKSLKIQICFPCNGQGVITCKICQGRGTASCRSCDGRGYHTNLKLERVPCRDCQGRGQWPCRECNEKGRYTHEACAGEGKVATWDEEVHTYSVNRIGETFLPPDAPPQAKELVDAWMEKHSRDLPEFSFEAVSTELGYATPELAAAVKQAESRRSAFSMKGGDWDDRGMFSAVSCRVVPMSACFVKSDGKVPHRFWLVGRGEDAVEIRPERLVDQWRIAGVWGGVVAIIAGIAALAGWHGYALHPESSNVAIPAIFGVIALLGAVVAGVGVSRFVRGRRTTVHVITIVPCSGDATVYLPCLASLGPAARKLEVLDRSWTDGIQEHLREERPTPRTRTVVVRTNDDVFIRLVEVGQPERLSHDEWSRIAEISQGILYIEDDGAAAEPMKARLHASTTIRPAEVSLKVDTVTPECDRKGTTDLGDLALDGIRRVLIQMGRVSLDWVAIFDALWAPVAPIFSKDGASRSPAPR
jgi:hypothetical protein